MKPYKIQLGGTSLSDLKKQFHCWIDLDHILGISGLRKAMAQRDSLHYHYDQVGYPSSANLCRADYTVHMAFLNEPLVFSKFFNGLEWDEHGCVKGEDDYVNHCRLMPTEPDFDVWKRLKMDVRILSMKEFMLGYDELLQAWTSKGLYSEAEAVARAMRGAL